MTSPRTIIAFVLTSFLAACGGQYDAEPGVQLASATISVRAASASVGDAGIANHTGAISAFASPGAAGAAHTATSASASATLPAAAFITVASATMPAPDCAAEGCGSLRIIDGNAEAWRLDAQRRAALEAALPQS